MFKAIYVAIVVLELMNILYFSALLYKKNREKVLKFSVLVSLYGVFGMATLAAVWYGFSGVFAVKCLGVVLLCVRSAVSGATLAHSVLRGETSGVKIMHHKYVVPYLFCYMFAVFLYVAQITSVGV